MSQNSLVDKLKARFGSSGLHDRFAVELRSRRTGASESIAELHADIRRLMALAYPETAHSQLGQVIARDHLITGLGDREIELKVRDRDPVDLEAAFRAAIRVEIYLKAYEIEKTSAPATVKDKTCDDHDTYRHTRNSLRFKRDKWDDHRIRQVAQSEEKIASVPENSNIVMAQLVVCSIGESTA